MNISLSLQQARKLALLSQRLPPVNQAGSATAATLAAIEQLGYIQIDTISVIQRAHHHTLWNRNPRYKAVQLSQLITEKKVFEYCLMPRLTCRCATTSLASCASMPLQLAR